MNGNISLCICTSVSILDKTIHSISGDISAPLEAPLRPKQVENLWLDIAKTIIQRVKRLAFKNPTRKDELDKLTLELNKQYEEVITYRV